MISNSNIYDNDIINYDVTLKNDLLYYEEKSEYNHIRLINLGYGSWEHQDLNLHIREFDLNRSGDYIIKKIVLKLDLRSYDNLLSNNDLISSLFNTDINLKVCNVTILETKLLNSFIFNKDSVTTNIDHVIIDIYNFEKYLTSIKTKKKGFHKRTAIQSINLSIIYNKILDEIYDNLYINYEIPPEEIDNCNSSSISSEGILYKNIYFNIDKININKNSNSFKFQCVDYTGNMYICIYIDSDIDNVIEEITLNCYSNITFHTINILGKTVYVIPLKFDLLDNLDNINNYVYDNINILLYKNIKIYNDALLLFNVKTSGDNYMSDIIIYNTNYYLI